MDTQDIVETWRREAIQEGVQQGLKQGVAHSLVEVYEAALARYPKTFARGWKALTTSPRSWHGCDSLGPAAPTRSLRPSARSAPASSQSASLVQVNVGLGLGLRHPWPVAGVQTRNGRVAPAAASSLVVLRAGGYSERRKAIRSERSCLEKPMWKRVS